MNSFWIPQLGSQIYAMAGMTTQLNLMADGVGQYSGSAAEINGAGFAGMKFVAKSVTQPEFDSWVVSAKRNNPTLSLSTYNKFAEPSENNPQGTYSGIQPDLFNLIMDKYGTHH